ncbi:hypothetical protein BZG36_04426 [Bifiguratus adelaidae]|uniref:Dihydropteridine reductase n=1 Tax=Bifiguratus adelaidae TaxID=1938954 RepID=A0A261XWR2_9FUNG|nr:hypothetical protein BZG36_04426 [Bifiguratus adelaidae]
MQTIGPESVVCAVGTVNKRPDRMINPALPTGEVEIVLEDLICLNKALNVPFLPGQKELPNEEVRMRYRYVDLRRPTVQGNLRTRSKAAKTIRDYLFSQNFVEVETPMLFKSTPEGAREFLVPTRSHNRFYALPQSPQQHKQLLMAGGIDRYFQFARCFRDEDLRADRQPEFTQVDLEMSFVQPNDVQKVIEAILKSVWKEVLAIELPANAFKRITYNDAMRRYGSDKPDTRYGMEIIDISAFVPDAAKDDVIECLVIRDGAKMTASEIKEILQSAAIQDLKSIPHVKINESNIDSWLKKQTFTHFSSHCEVAGREIARQKEVKIGDAIFLHKRPAFLSGGNTPLGRIRVAAASKMATKGLLSIDPSQYNFMWVDSFPLFSPDEEGKRTLTSTHHPFTAPEPDDIDLLISNPEKHYDIVLNGIEVGGGSIRIHSAELQTFILERVLRLQKEEYNRFSHLVDALASGCPPHGGIALGRDGIDLKDNHEANQNILIGGSDTLEAQAESAVSGVRGFLAEQKVDAILCVAGGWAGGNAKSKDFLKNTQLMMNQSANSSLIASRLAALYLKEGGILTLTGALAAAQGGTPGMIGYGLAKAAVHHLVQSLGASGSGLPNDAQVVAICPVTLDTPMNRKFMADADTSKWTPLEEVAKQLYGWCSGEIKVSNGKLVEVQTDNGQTTFREL